MQHALSVYLLTVSDHNTRRTILNAGLNPWRPSGHQKLGAGLICHLLVHFFHQAVYLLVGTLD